MEHQRFRYKTLEEFSAEVEGLGVDIPVSRNIAALAKPLHVGGIKVPNRIAVQPMEGCDGTLDGAPDALTRRRYLRFAAGGAGLIWFEAVAVVPEGRANPRQLYIHEGNLDAFRAICGEIREAGMKANGYAPILICQLTHSGRYSKPQGKPAPIIAYNNPLFEGENPIDSAAIASDAYLDSLPARYAHAAALAAEAGFDGVDIKCCHRYLLNECLSAFERPGPYGGSFENRTRLLREAVEAARAAVPTGCLVTSRLNLYDGFPYPYGFGVARDGMTEPMLAESIALARLLHETHGMALLDCTIGNPYVNPHVNRPYDRGGYVPPEHPLEGMARMFACIGEVKAACPGLALISSGHSYPRAFAGNVAAGVVERGMADMAGFGRMAFAYPDFARDLLQNGALDEKRVCMACGKCTELMRMGKVAGCPVRDQEVYLPIYRA